MLTKATPAAYEELEQIELRYVESRTLSDIRFSLANSSVLAQYLDDFLPGHQSQYLTATLQPKGDGWLLRIRIPSIDDTGEWRFTAAGDFAR